MSMRTQEIVMIGFFLVLLGSAIIGTIWEHFWAKKRNLDEARSMLGRLGEGKER